MSYEFAPVCPQVLPNLREEVKPGRYKYLERHLPYLKNQSEDCLYLNIYAPHQDQGKRDRQFGDALLIAGSIITGLTIITRKFKLREIRIMRSILVETRRERIG